MSSKKIRVVTLVVLSVAILASIIYLLFPTPVSEPVAPLPPNSPSDVAIKPNVGALQSSDSLVIPITIRDDSESVSEITQPAEEPSAPTTRVEQPSSTSKAPPAPPVTSQTPVVSSPPAPIVVAPVTPSTPVVVDHTPRFRHNSNYEPACGSMIFKYSQETSSGGTVVISVAYKYDATTYNTVNGFGAKIYICADQS